MDADVSPTLNAHDLEGSDIRATTVVFGPKGDIADPVSANEHKTWTHEGTTFRTHNVVVGAESVEPPPEAFGFKASHFTRGKESRPSPVMPPLSADADKGDQDAVIFQPASPLPRFHCLKCDRRFGVNDYESNTVTCPSCGNKRIDSIRDADDYEEEEPEVAPTVNGTQRQQVDGAIDGHGSVEGSVGIPRRLMPVECERLQGWSDNWTNVPKKIILVHEDGRVGENYPSDAKRYRAIGNGVAKPVAQWIAWRIRLAAAEAYLTLSGK